MRLPIPVDPWQSQNAKLICPMCPKKCGDHTLNELHACADKQKKIVLQGVVCPVCGQLVLEHSANQRRDCWEKGGANRPNPYREAISLLQEGIREMNDAELAAWRENVRQSLGESSKP